MDEILSGQNPAFKRILVTFNKAVTPEDMANDKKIMGEFMRCIGSNGLGFEFEEGEPVSWSGEVYEALPVIQERLQAWWREYSPDCVVHNCGTTNFRTTTEQAHKFTIEPA